MHGNDAAASDGNGQPQRDDGALHDGADRRANDDGVCAPARHVLQHVMMLSSSRTRTSVMYVAKRCGYLVLSSGRAWSRICCRAARLVARRASSSRGGRTATWQRARTSVTSRRDASQPRQYGRVSCRGRGRAARRTWRWRWARRRRAPKTASALGSASAVDL